jgi:CPA2 family monovalent cation:H+ antiporter-2
VLHAEGLKGLIIFLAVAGIIVPLFHRARIGAVLGFLIAGVVLGPQGLGRFADTVPWLGYITFDDPERGALLAEAGIIVLLFLLGLELSLQRLWQLRRFVLGVGFAQVLLSTLAIGAVVRLLVDVPPAGIVLGLCLALSSTAVVMQLLAEQHRVAHPSGRIALSVLLFQDLMVVPILFVVGILAGAKQGTPPAGIADLVQPFALALGAVVGLLLVGRFLVRPLLRSAVATGSRDLIMAIALLILVLFAVATGLSGLSVALGAFLAGMLLSDSEARHHIEVDLEPFKGLLLGIFFITVGTKLDPLALAGDAGWILLALVALLGVKIVILYGVSRAFGVSRSVAVEVALLLAQAGEFAFVVVGVAEQSALLPPRLVTGAIAVVALSMMVTPLLAVAARKLAVRFEPTDQAGHEPAVGIDELDGHVVIGGLGRVGQTVARALEAEGIPYIALDTDGARVRATRNDGLSVYFGDSGRPEMLERVGGRRARAFVVTVNNADAAERMVSAARSVRPDAVVLARAADAPHAVRLLSLGAVGVIPETVEASLQLAARVLEKLDLPEAAVDDRIEAMRQQELKRLQGQG